MQTIDIIKGECRTNLDDYSCPVTGFARVPNIGESVVCFYRGCVAILEVVQITHDFKNGEPFILVELSKRMNKIAW